MDAGDYDDRPLSNRSDFEPSDEDQEMVSVGGQLGTNAGDEEVMGAGPMNAETGGDNMGCSVGNPEGIQDPVLPSTSNQPPGPTAPDTRTLASTVEAWALTSPALAITMAQIQEASTAGDTTGTDDEKV